MSQSNITILKLVNTLARIAPFLAPLIEKATDYLIRRRESTNDIVVNYIKQEQNITPTQPESVSSQTGQVVQGVEISGEAKVDRGDEAQRNFLEHMEKSLEDSRRRLEKDQEEIRSQEAIIFRVFIFFALVGIAFIIFGGYLMVRGASVQGALAGIVGLISGAGSAILRYLAERLSERRSQIRQEQKEQVQVLQAVQAALALSGTERNQELSKVAAWLRERAMQSLPSRKG